MESMSIKELAAYGIDSIDSNTKIQVDLKDLVYVYRSIEEMRKFFHNQNHYQNFEVLNHVIGDKDQGILYLLNTIYKDIFNQKIIVGELDELVNGDTFSPDAHPDYYFMNGG